MRLPPPPHHPPPPPPAPPARAGPPRAGAPGLRGPERGADHLVGEVGDLADGVRELHPAALAAAAGVDLRLDDPPAAAELLGDASGGAIAVHDLARRHRDAVALEELLRLVLVDVHGVHLRDP